MPTALARACPRYGCPETQPCPAHGRKAKQAAYDGWRGSSSSRGYDTRWRQFTEQFRNELAALGIPPTCGARLPGTPDTQDSDCQAKGYITNGRVVDHIQPVSGASDPRFYDQTNLQILCDGVTGRGCHDRKRQRERGQ